MQEIYVSYCESIKSNSYKKMPLEFLINSIKSDGSIKDKIGRIRNISDSSLRQEKKREILPHFNFGTFKKNKRANENLTEIQFLTFDFDKLTDDQFTAAYSELKKNPATFLLFRSASGGNRFKAVFRLDQVIKKQISFEAVWMYYFKQLQEKLQVEIDVNNKNSQVGSFISYDPDLYYNPNSQLLSTKVDFQNSFNSVPSSGEYQDLSNLEEAVKFLRGKLENFTEYKIIKMALASLGETGREHFINICADNPNYPSDTPAFLNSEFDLAVKAYSENKANKIRINSLFYIAKTKGYEIPRKFFEYSEMGLAERLVYSYGHKIKFCLQSKKWLIWNGKYWKEDREGVIYDFYKEILNKLKEELKAVQDEDLKKKLQKHYTSAQTTRTRKAAIEWAQSDKKIRVDSDNLDADGDLLNCQSHVIRLHDGRIEVTEHNPDFNITKICNASLDKNADCPKWQQFLDTIFQHDNEMINFIQRAIGYSITSDVREGVLFFMYGSGANGKSVFIEALNLLFGEYYKKAQIESFLNGDKMAGQANPDLINIKGARLVVGSEIPDNKAFNDKLIKDLTGQDAITARPLYGEYITFKPVCKIWLYGNHRPVLKSTDYGLRRRVLLIPFNYTIPQADRRNSLEILEEFKAELSGILNWALDGYINWHEKKLSPPEQIREATEEYFKDNDLLGSFIDECCIVEANEKSVLNDFRNIFNVYSKQKGEHELPTKRLAEKLREKGYAVKNGTGNKTTVFGLSIKLESKAEYNADAGLLAGLYN